MPDVRTLVLTWLSLMVLLGATFAAYFVNLGPLNTAVAFTIAVGKTLLVLLIFMHLHYRSSLTRVVSGVGFLWLAFLIGLILTDYGTRHPGLFNFLTFPG